MNEKIRELRTLPLRLRLGDVIVIVLVILLATVFLVGLSRERGDVVTVTVDGEVYATYSLRVDGVHLIETEYGSNTLVIDEGVAYITHSDCTDGTCVAMGGINRGGERIICIPNRLVVSIPTKGEVDAVS